MAIDPSCSSQCGSAQWITLLPSNPSSPSICRAQLQQLDNPEMILSGAPVGSWVLTEVPQTQFVIEAKLHYSASDRVHCLSIGVLTGGQTMGVSYPDKNLRSYSFSTTIQLNTPASLMVRDFFCEHGPSLIISHLSAVSAEQIPPHTPFELNQMQVYKNPDEPAVTCQVKEAPPGSWVFCEYDRQAYICYSPQKGQARWISTRDPVNFFGHMPELDTEAKRHCVLCLLGLIPPNLALEQLEMPATQQKPLPLSFKLNQMEAYNNPNREEVEKQVKQAPAGCWVFCRYNSRTCICYNPQRGQRGQAHWINEHERVAELGGHMPVIDTEEKRSCVLRLLGALH